MCSTKEGDVIELSISIDEMENNMNSLHQN